MKNFQNALRAHGRGDLAVAEAGYLATLSIDTRHVDALRLLGLLYHQLGNDSLAAAFLTRATTLSPDDATLFLDLGVICKLNSHLERAVDHLTRATTLDPTLPAAHMRLGEVHAAMENWNAAIQCFRMTARLDPNDAQVMMQLGQALHQAERPREAIVAFRSAIGLNPASVSARVAAAASLCAIEDYEKALPHLAGALELDDSCLSAWYNRGCAALGLGNYDDAVMAFSRAIELQPDWPTAHLNRALSLLSAGDFSRGLPAYEWRTATTLPPKDERLPARWEGEPTGEKILLIDAEQGLGDTIQFLRFVDIARTVASNIILRVQSAVLPLVKRLASAWQIEVIDGTAEPTRADLSCALMSLPYVLKISLDAPPWSAAYLQAPTSYREKWRSELKRTGRRRVGLTWSGHRRPHDNRPVPLRDLSELFVVDDIDWIVLQRELTESEASFLKNHPCASRIHFLSKPLSDMADTAAVIEHLDTVLSIDTSVAHLSSAMGVPTILMLPFASDWRWRIDAGETSRWYRSARLIKQKQPGQWEGVVSEARRILQANAMPSPKGKSRAS